MKIKWNKKYVLIAAISAAAAIGIMAGVVFAQPNGTNSQPGDQQTSLLDKVCQIYQQNTGTTIDPTQLQTAFNQAEQQMQREALANRLQQMVDKGTITQDEADAYLKWWDARPSTLSSGAPFFKGMRGGFWGPRLGGHGWFGPDSNPPPASTPAPGSAS